MKVDEIQKSKILIVDDKIQNVLLLQGMLDVSGYSNVISTTDPRQVSKLYIDESPDLILLDFRMPHMDAVDVMEELVRTKPEAEFVPLIVLTAQNDKETRDRALSAGADDFITKPFDNDEVLLRIRNALTTRSFFLGQKHRADVLESEVKKRTQEIFDIQFEVIRGLGRAGEYRDNETGLHVVRMSESCKIMALELGLGERYAEEILQAAPLHDVGKIGVPDHILLKPGKLTDDEFETMKQHVDYGESIIGSLETPVLEMARNVARYHHERWDGKGYLHGLSGEEIPLEARIAAVGDVFDALTSERPYKKPWPVSDAIEHIKKNSGTHFDPKVVDALVASLDKILVIKSKYAD